MTGIDWSKVGPKLCPTDGCEHRIELAFTPAHPWSLDCERGRWWRGCLAAAAPREPGRQRCECPGCQPMANVKLNLRLTRKRCRCDPQRIAAELAARTEEVGDGAVDEAAEL